MKQYKVISKFLMLLMFWVLLPKSYLHCFDGDHLSSINTGVHAISCQFCEAEFDLFDASIPSDIAFEITEHDFIFINFYVSPFQTGILNTYSGLSPPAV